ncbi:MAG: 30S ribosomal protein S8 [Patescibacteria group bacterium]
MINSLSCDLFIRIKNASLSGKKTITAPFSSFSENILIKLKSHGFIAGFSVDKDKKSFVITSPRVTDIRLLSKPGCRLYSKHSSLPWGKTQNSLIIVSTSAGLLSQKEAAVKKLGGELIAEIY